MEAEDQSEDIVVQISQKVAELDVSPERLEKLVENICQRFGACKAQINIEIVDDAHIHQLNKQFLNHDQPTDCLSFDLSDSEALSPRSFDLVVNAEMAKRQSQSRGHSSEAELALYITHGLLHNLGFDDSTQTKAKEMHAIEDEILQQQGFGVIYNTDSE